MKEQLHLYNKGEEILRKRDNKFEALFRRDANAWGLKKESRRSCLCYSWKGGEKTQFVGGLRKLKLFI